MQGDAVEHLVRAEPRGDRPRIDLRSSRDRCGRMGIEVDVGVSQIDDPVVIVDRRILWLEYGLGIGVLVDVD